jgi:methionine-rich copper-binding protein CopC
MIAVLPAVLLLGSLTLAPSAAAAGPCTAPVLNKVACENTKPGTPDWVVSAIDDSIVGYTSDISYAPGNTVNFKVKTDASAYTVNIYRLGYYGGDGARLVTTLHRTTRQTQPNCLTPDAATGLTDCGNWATSMTWTVPSDQVSGLYYAVLDRDDTHGESEIAFVLRDDTSHSDVMFQTSDATWQAYNTYGNGSEPGNGNSLYSGSSNGNGGSAYKVSYNRPIIGGETENFIFNAEYPMLKFLEANGYDLSYTTDVDTARRGNLITNHKVFMPVGHDEYWSNEQRASVENARAAGVNMAFMTGNDAFWKTRWENSSDSSASPWRTMVCYKETKAGQVDPTNTWTGTWRDPRYTPPKDGNRPENSLLGQIFTVNGRRDDSMSVPAAYGKMRLWRGTALANMAANTSYTFQPGTLGYEWDTVEDNGFQPPGVAQMSRTTVAMTGQYVLQNYGDVYDSGTKTHALTMYRYQPSGALIFAAGTVQWAWGVEDEHLFRTATPTSDVRIKQATVNLLADMGAQPVTLQSGLSLATKSTDTTPPVVSIGSTPPPTVAAPYTITGTVGDSAGVVSGVEVSVDNGTSWHAANWQAGSGNWNYTYSPAASGPATFQVRAVDDSANLSTPVTRSVTVNTRPCPCSIWTDTTVPRNPSIDDSSALEVGVKFQANANGYIRGVKFYKGTGNTGTHTGSLWTTGGQLLATGTFTGETVNGWQTLTFPTSVPVTANTTYLASYHTDTGHYSGDSDYFTNGPNGLEPLRANQATTTDPNGVYKVGASGFPDRSFGNTNYWVDVVFGYDPGPDTRAPLIASQNPGNGQSSVALNTTPTVTFDEPISPSSLQLTLTGPSGAVTGTTSLSTDGKTATFTPSQQLASGANYTVSVRASDTAGNALPNAPVTWTFKTGSPRPAGCPCTIWDDFATPQVASAADSAVEVGTKVRFDSRGQVLGIRFYKGAGNTGTHTGSLWSSTGTRLATGTFSGESTSGWQTLTFSSPVDVQSGTTYVVSYYAPNGGYATNSGYFANGGADYTALHALANGVDGGNGVYRYGAGGGFPTSSYNASNYWVDVVWQPGANGDSTPPTVSSKTPAAGATGVSPTAPLSVTFSEPVDLATAQVGLTDSGGAKLTGTPTLSTDKKTLTWTPAAALTGGSTYSASVRIADLNGNLMPAPTTWSFTTSATQACPCTLFSAATVPTVTAADDTGSYELGVRFTTSANGTVTGVKFYKGAGNTGTHTGSLWTDGGQLLATGTFSGESTGGWQTLTFATPVTVTAGQSYVASYTAPSGHYAADNGYFQRTAVTSPPLSAPATGPGTANGVYNVGPGFPASTFQGGNYWVDVIFHG